MVMIFDIGGAIFGLGNLAGLVKDNSVPGSEAAYLSAAVGEYTIRSKLMPTAGCYLHANQMHSAYCGDVRTVPVVGWDPDGLQAH